MFPFYNKDSVVLLEEIIGIEFLVFGNEYVIETKDYRMLKRIEKSSQMSFLSCYSVNKERHLHNNKLIYEPFEVSFEKIVGFYPIVGVVSKNEEGCRK